MDKARKTRLTLYQPTTYQIKVPGHIDKARADWAWDLTLVVETGEDGTAISTLTGEMDQAALLGLLRRLNSLGLPLISVLWVG